MGFIGYQTMVHLMKCVQAEENATEDSEKKLYPRPTEQSFGRVFVAFSNPAYAGLLIPLFKTSLPA